MRLRDIEAQSLGVQIHLVGTLFQNAGNVSCVFEFSEIDVTSALLDGVSDEFSGASLTLGADNHGLLLLAGFVDDESGALGLLLSDLLCFDGSSEFGGEGKVLRGVISIQVVSIGLGIAIPLGKHHPA